MEDNKISNRRFQPNNNWRDDHRRPQQVRQSEYNPRAREEWDRHQSQAQPTKIERGQVSGSAKPHML